jgi:hypothetical protein
VLELGPSACRPRNSDAIPKIYLSTAIVLFKTIFIVLRIIRKRLLHVSNFSKTSFSRFPFALCSLHLRHRAQEGRWVLPYITTTPTSVLGSSSAGRPSNTSCRRDGYHISTIQIRHVQWTERVRIPYHWSHRQLLAYIPRIEFWSKTLLFDQPTTYNLF